MDLNDRYPLSWPHGWKRTPPNQRRFPRFSTRESVHHAHGDKTWTTQRTKDLSVATATDRLLEEMGRIGATDVTISSNVELRLDGLPRSNQRTPTDPGVAVYFKLKKKDRCLACDTYVSVAGNLAALAAHVSALRAIERYGVGTIDQAFAGYTALPPNASVDWRQVFGFDITWKGPIAMSMVDERFKMMARTAHPDAGGSHVEMSRLTEARDAARLELAP